MKKVILSVFISVLCLLTNVISIGAADMEKGKIYINGKEIVSEDTMLIGEDKVWNTTWVPFRAVFENMGEEVTYDNETGDIYFTNKGEKYYCRLKIEVREKFPDLYYITIMDVNKMGSMLVSDYIKLAPWGYSGNYRNFNGRIYIDQRTAEYLFDYLGCTTEFDLDKKELRIDY